LILNGKKNIEQDGRDTSCSVPVFKLIFGDIFVFNAGQALDSGRIRQPSGRLRPFFIP